LDSHRPSQYRTFWAQGRIAAGRDGARGRGTGSHRQHYLERGTIRKPAIADTYSNRNTNTHANRDSHTYADCDANSHTYADASRYAEAYSYTTATPDSAPATGVKRI